MVILTNAAESNRTRLRYVEEVTWGTTPGSGVTKEMRLTSSGLETTKETKVSEEIRADRMVPSIIEVAAGSSGSIDFEFSAGAVDDFIEGFLLGTWTLDMNFWKFTGTRVDVTGAGEITITGTDVRPYLAVNQYLKLEGFTTAANNAYVKISALAFTAGNTVITVTGATLSAEAGTAYSKVLDAGDVILKSTATAFEAGNKINGGGANSFAGKTLKVGQRIWIEGLGKETGTLQFNVTDPPEGSTVTLSDGVDSLVFEIRTNAALVAEGNIHVALSGTPATMAASLAAAVMTQFSRGNFRVSATVVTDTVTVTNHRLTGGSIAASDSGASVTVVALSGGSATKGGFYTIASLPDDDSIVTEETLTADANSGTLPVIIKGSHVRNPGDVADIVKRSYTIETGFTDVSKYFLRNGMRVGSIEFNVQAGDIVTGTVEFMGRQTLNSSTETLNGGGYTVQDATATEVLNATANVGSILKNGTAIDAALMSISFKGDASLREQRAVGEKFPAGIGFGRFSLEGSTEAYFKDFNQYNDFLNHATNGLAFNFTDADFNTYYFTLAALKYTADPIAPGGIDEDIMEKLEFTAQRDPVLNTMFMVDRFSSVFPFIG